MTVTIPDEAAEDFIQKLRDEEIAKLPTCDRCDQPDASGLHDDDRCWFTCSICGEADETLNENVLNHEQCEDEVFAYRDQVRRAWLGL